MNTEKALIILDGLLFVVFIILKLTNFLKWSWFWILSLIWGPPALYFLILAAVFVLEAIKLLWRKRNGN